MKRCKWQEKKEEKSFFSIKLIWKWYENICLVETEKGGLTPEIREQNPSKKQESRWEERFPFPPVLSFFITSKTCDKKTEIGLI